MKIYMKKAPALPDKNGQLEIDQLNIEAIAASWQCRVEETLQRLQLAFEVGKPEDSLFILFGNGDRYNLTDMATR